MSTTGDQINQKIDVPAIGCQFVNFYFQNLKENINNLYSSKMIKKHTRLKYKNLEYKEQALQNILIEIGTTLQFFIEDILVMDSGARRADILVHGHLIQNGQDKKYRFSQYFTIANNHDDWFIHNSLLSILD